MTENHNYNAPSFGEENWHKLLNDNFADLDSDVEIRDLASNRSDYTPKSGAKFKATDTEEEWIGDGNSWQKLQSEGKNPTFESIVHSISIDSDQTFTIPSDYGAVVAGPLEGSGRIEGEGRLKVV